MTKLINDEELGRHLEENKELFGEVAFQRWENPLCKGEIIDPDGYLRLTGKCGESVEIFLKFNGERVHEASFLTDGCGAVTVCGSFAAEMAMGKTPDEILEVTGESIIQRLGGFPKEEAHCAFLAAETLQDALHSYMIKSGSAGGKRAERRQDSPPFQGRTGSLQDAEPAKGD
ncbi:MAG: iron-sulfur cluster assembly scaffold protein [Deltaproteobacteria bacterium]|nr:iron-sulfur cluster assembly scaffold protein [Deltaproteobacteria bacterium]